MQTRYVVSGMTCDHCVAHVTQEVAALPGVDAVDVRLDGAMTVTSQQPIAWPAIVAAIDEAGDYTVSLAED
jgi:copper chaperone CopZ